MTRGCEHKHQEAEASAIEAWKCVDRGEARNTCPLILERVADLDVVAQPRHLEDLSRECLGRCYQLEFAAIRVDLVGELLDQAKALAVEVRDLGEIDDHTTPILDRAFELVMRLVGV